MGWQFRWVSSTANDFNNDFHVSFTPEERANGEVDYNYGMTGFPHEEAPGISVFYKDDAGEIFHTYSTYRARRGSDDGHLQPARPRAQGPRRARRLLQDGVGAPPRPLRAAAARRPRPPPPRAAQRRREAEPADTERARHGAAVAMAGDRRRRRAPRAEPGHRLDARRGLRRACARRGAGAPRAGPDRLRAGRVDERAGVGRVARARRSTAH